MRLSIGGGLNLCLWPVWGQLSVSGSDYRHYWLTLAGGILATVALATLVPLFWRGEAWQAPIAFIFLWLPCIVFFAVVQMIIGLL